MAPLPNSQNTELCRRVEEFLTALEVERGSSPLTIRNYTHYLKRFCLWLEKYKKRGSIKDITPPIIRDYRLYLSRLDNKKGETLSKRTQGYHVIALRSFLRWLIRENQPALSPDKIDIPKVSERQVKFLTGEQIDRLLNAPSLSTLAGRRDKAILEVLFSTGLRVSELVKLNRDRVDLERREFGIIGKGGRARVVFLSTRAAKYLRDYLNQRKDNFNPLFIRHKGTLAPSEEKMRLTARSVQRIVKKYARKIKLPVDVTPHVLRHSFATDLLIAGADIRSVQEMLGHKNIATTQVYTHVTHKHLKEIHEVFHGRGN